MLNPCLPIPDELSEPSFFAILLIQQLVILVEQALTIRKSELVFFKERFKWLLYKSIQGLKLYQKRSLSDAWRWRLGRRFSYEATLLIRYAVCRAQAFQNNANGWNRKHVSISRLQYSLNHYDWLHRKGFQKQLQLPMPLYAAYNRNHKLFSYYRLIYSLTHPLRITLIYCYRNSQSHGWYLSSNRL